MIADEVKIRSEFANKVEKLEKKKKTHVQLFSGRMEKFKKE